MKKNLIVAMLALLIAAPSFAGTYIQIGPLGLTTTVLLLLKSNEGPVFEDALVARQSKYQVISAILQEKLDQIRDEARSLDAASDQDLIDALIHVNQ